MNDFLNNPPNWAWVSGFDDVEWSQECVPRPDIEWPRMESPPTIGGRYGLLSPHRLPRNSFWVLFRPALSALNGWGEYPTEFGSSCVVCCEWERSLGEFDWGVYGKRYGEVIIATEVIALRDLAKLVPPNTSGAVPEIPTTRTYRVDWEDLTLFDCNVQVNLGGYFVCQSVSDEHTLLLCGEFDFSPSFFCAGNRPLSDSEYRALEERYRP